MKAPGSRQGLEAQNTRYAAGVRPLRWGIGEVVGLHLSAPSPFPLPQAKQAFSTERESPRLGKMSEFSVSFRGRFLSVYFMPPVVARRLAFVTSSGRTDKWTLPTDTGPG